MSADGDFARSLDLIRPGLGDLWIDDTCEDFNEVVSTLTDDERHEVDVNNAFRVPWLWGGKAPDLCTPTCHHTLDREPERSTPLSPT